MCGMRLCKYRKTLGGVQKGKGKTTMATATRNSNTTSTVKRGRGRPKGRGRQAIVPKGEKVGVLLTPEFIYWMQDNDKGEMVDAIKEQVNLYRALGNFRSMSMEELKALRDKQATRVAVLDLALAKAG